MNDKEKKVVKLINDWYDHRYIAKKVWIAVGSVSHIRNRNLEHIDECRWGKNQWWNNPQTNFINAILNNDFAEDEISQLDKALEKLSNKYWVNISVNRDWFIPHENKRIEPYRWWNKDNVLVISDLHSPFILEWYLEFCREAQERFDCGTVVMIWDIIDFHSISFHSKLPEELNPSGELARAREMLKDWYYTFPEVTVTLGNHDKLPRRQAASLWLPRELIQNENVVFHAPDSYKFVEEVVIDNVLYTHWSSSNAFKKCILENMNMVSWHAHTQCWIVYHQNRHWKLFGMQVWVGIDYKAKAFDYARSNSRYPVSACWVVLDNWTLPIIVPFDI